MSVSSEISRLSSAKSSIRSAIQAKGVTVPASTTLDGYASLIAAIPTGSSPRVANVTGTRTSATSISFSVQGEPLMWAVQLNVSSGSYISGGTTRYVTSVICDGTTAYSTCIYRSGSTAREYVYNTVLFSYSNGTLTITTSTSTTGSWYSGTNYYRLIYVY